MDLVCRWYLPHLERIHDDAAIRQADLQQLAQIASTYSTRERFLTELTLDPPDATSDEAGTPLLDEDYLVLSTIHSAKGQEWTSVLVLNVIDGCIPSDLGTGSRAEIEEERRLLYVAMTRAKDHLDLIMPQRFFAHQQKSNGDRHMYAARTRFITALDPPPLRELCLAQCRREADRPKADRRGRRHRHAIAPDVDLSTRSAPGPQCDLRTFFSDARLMAGSDAARNVDLSNGRRNGTIASGARKRLQLETWFRRGVNTCPKVQTWRCLAW